MMNFERQQRRSRSTNRLHKITLNRVVRDRNDAGDVVTTATVLPATGAYWASVSPITEKQRSEHDRINVEATHFVRCDARLDIRETDQILFDSRTFEILSIAKMFEVNRDYLITTKELRPK